MTSSAQIAKRIDAKRQEIAERIDEINREREVLDTEYADLETQHKLLDELVDDGDASPFERSKPSPVSPSKPGTKTGPDGQPLPMKPPGGRSTPKPRRVSQTRPKISTRKILETHVKTLVEQYPAKWITPVVFKSLIENGQGVKLPSAQRVSQLLKSFSEDGAHPWFRRHVSGKKSWYSLHSRHGGTAPKTPDKANTLQ